MKILLVGEYSGVHNNLKKGLIELGHDVVIAADGDGFKEFPYDINLQPYSGGYMARLINSFIILFKLKLFVGYDIVQFISPFTVPTTLYYLGIMRYIFSKNKKVYYYACGTDPNYFKASIYLKYFPFDKPEIYTKHRLNYFNWFIRNVDAVIPATYSYYLGYKNQNKCSDPIPLPSSGNYAKKVKTKSGKLNLLFGITRRDFKGADYIQEALNKVKEDYKDKINIKVVEKLPFRDYVKILDETDILIDQCKSYSYGMNAIYAMEKGVIVLSGNENEAKKFLNITDEVPINIRPNANHIYSIIAGLINLSDEEVIKYKRNSVNHIIRHHHYTDIAGKFCQLYSK